MAISRRDVLKELAFTAMLPCLDLNSFVNAMLLKPDPPDRVYILLHGFFFLQFDFGAGSLWVATPEYTPPHVVATRNSGDVQPHTLQRGDFRYKDKLKPGPHKSFPRDMLQFPASALTSGFNGLAKATADQFYCRMEFPVPDDIYPFRQGPATQFCPTGTQIAPKLTHGKIIPTITCLAFTPADGNPSVESYYAEHATRPSIPEVNAALRAAKKLCGNQFDLQLKGCGGKPANYDQDSDLPSGVHPEDEKELEDLPAPEPKRAPKQGTKPAAQHPQKEQVRAFAGDPSSCPQFGIT